MRESHSRIANRRWVIYTQSFITRVNTLWTRIYWWIHFSEPIADRGETHAIHEPRRKVHSKIKFISQKELHLEILALLNWICIGQCTSRISEIKYKLECAEAGFYGGSISQVWEFLKRRSRTHSPKDTSFWIYDAVPCFIVNKLEQSARDRVIKH